MADGNTTISIPIPLDDRIKKLAKLQADKLGLSKTLAKATYLEILVAQEELRIKTEATS